MLLINVDELINTHSVKDVSFIQGCTLIPNVEGFRNTIGCRLGKLDTPRWVKSRDLIHVRWDETRHRKRLEFYRIDPNLSKVGIPYQEPSLFEHGR